METTYRKVKSRKEIEAWLVEHDWQEHQGTYINPYSVGVFNKDMFRLCGEDLRMMPLSSKYDLFKGYRYMDTTNAYGWLEGWLEQSIAEGRTSFDKSAKADLSSKDATREDCEIQQ